MINKNIFYRFEPNLKDGTLLIFDLQKKKVYEGGKLEYEIMKLFQNGYDGKRIIDFFHKNSTDAVYKNVDRFVKQLIELNIVE